MIIEPLLPFLAGLCVGAAVAYIVLRKTNLIRTYTNPGDLVMDNCAGSGTTAIAALNSGRHYICIEQDPEYASAAKQRVHDHETAKHQIPT